MRHHRENPSKAHDMHYIVPGLPFYKHFGNGTEMIPGIVADLAGKCYRQVCRTLRRLRTFGAEDVVTDGLPTIQPNTASHHEK